MANSNPSPENRFTSENQPENKGRKKNKLKELIKESQFSTADIRAIFANIISIQSIEDIKQMITDKETDFMLKAYLKAMLNDYQKGKTDTIDKLIEYAFGKPKQVIESKNINHVNTLDINTLTEKEKDRILAEGIKLMADERRKADNGKTD